MQAQIKSSDVLDVIKNALFNLCKERTESESNKEKSLQKLEKDIEAGFVDELYESLRLWDGFSKKYKTQHGFVGTTCEGLECFFIPCLDVAELDIDDFLIDIYGLADCLLYDISFLIDKCLTRNGNLILSLRGDPYALHEVKLRKRKQTVYRQIPNIDAASFILSSCLMAKHFLETLLNHSQKKDEYDLPRIKSNLNLILNKGIEALLENHRKCEGKGWALDFACFSPSILGTWATLEFIADIDSYRDNEVMMEDLNQDLIQQLDSARDTSHDWLYNTNTDVIEKEFAISDIEKRQYRSVIDELQDKGLTGEEFASRMKKRANRVLGANVRERMEKEFLKIYDKTQLLFSLLLSGKRYTEFINKALVQVIEFYFDDDIWTSFIDREMPPEKEYVMYTQEEGGRKIHASWVDYGIVFEVFRMILKYLESYSGTEIPKEIEKFDLNGKLASIYDRDIIKDRCKAKGVEYLWSKPHFELNYTENAIEAITVYYNYLKKKEWEEEFIDLPTAVRIPIHKLIEMLSRYLPASKEISDEKIAKAVERYLRSEKSQLREIMEFWRINRDQLKEFVKHRKQSGGI